MFVRDCMQKGEKSVENWRDNENCRKAYKSILQRKKLSTLYFEIFMFVQLKYFKNFNLGFS